MSEWIEVPLASLLKDGAGISYGIVQPGGHHDNGVPILRVTDIRHSRIDTTRPLRVSPDIAAAYARTRLKGGELLLTLVGTVGETAVVPADLEGWNHLITHNFSYPWQVYDLLRIRLDELGRRRVLDGGAG